MAKADGAWSGEIYYFGDFQVDEAGLQAWIDSEYDSGQINGVKNAFIEAWGRFRQQLYELSLCVSFHLSVI